MGLILAIVIASILYATSPVLAGIFTVFAIVFFYKSFQRTKHMTNEEVDIALNLNLIKDRKTRAEVKSVLEERINERMNNGKNKRKQ